MKSLFRKTLLLVFSLLVISSSVFAEDISEIRLSINLENKEIKEIFSEITKRTEYKFIYSSANFDSSKRMSINFADKPLNEVLSFILSKQPVTYKVEGKEILIVKRDLPTRKLVGVVKDSNGETLPGVNVVVKGTTNGDVTDLDGKFELTVDNAEIETLLISSMGYKGIEKFVGDRTDFSFILFEDAQDIEEVVVVGYGTQKKANLTGAVSTVSTKQMAKRPVSSTTKALQGVAPGLTVIDRGGMAGTNGTIITIRGTTSIKGNSSPLVFVDGIEQSMSDIDPNEIESISILKDAASTSIYGSRGANGVILITTKRAKDAKLRVSYNGYFAIQNIVTLPEKVGIRDYMTLYNEAYTNDGQPAPFSAEDIDNTVSGKDPYRWPNTDWHDVIFDPAPQHSHSLNISTGTEAVKYNLSVNYLDQQGILVSNNDLKRYNIRMNTDITFNSKLRGRFDFNYRRKDWTEPKEVWSVFWRLFHDMPPWGLPRTKDGKYGTSIPGNNQLARLESGRANKLEDYTVISGKLDYEPIEGLIISGEAIQKTTKYSNRVHQKQVKLYNWNGTYAKDLISDNSTEHQEKNWEELLLRATVNYSKSLGANNFKLLLGAERNGQCYNDVWAKRKKAYNNILDVINAGDSETDENSGNAKEFRLGSYFGRLNYNYAEKYLLEANFRYDGSSRFAQGNTRWGFFPSVSGAWRIKEEPFLKNVDWLHNLKLRASYGETGKQDNIDYWQYISEIKMGNVYAFGTDDKAAIGAYQGNFSNQEISWETTKIADIGLEADFFKGKLGFVLGLYKKTTEGILNNKIPIPQTVGLPNPAVNSGTIENKGWEFTITHNGKIGEDFSYDLVFNISDNYNEVIDLVGTGPYIGGWQIVKEGEPINSLWGYQTIGFYKDASDLANSPKYDPDAIPGDLKYADRNGDNIINGDDKYYLGDSNPHLPISLNVNMRYKEFDFSMFWQGVLDQLSYMNGALTEGPNYGNFTHKEMLGRWTPATAETATWPILRKNSWRSQRESDFWIREAAYLRLKNIQLGYTIPKSITNSIGINRLRFYVSGDNLLTFSQEELIDPEFQPGRVNYHPQTKLYMFGINLDF
jgi:TonB-linked SusC/RagA family outer membrane protein